MRHGGLDLEKAKRHSVPQIQALVFIGPRGEPVSKAELQGDPKSEPAREQSSLGASGCGTPKPRLQQLS